MTMRNDSDADWEQLGRSDPYHAVLTDERYRRGQLTDATRTAFFRSGEEHIERIFRIVREHLMADFHPEHALDFGCGVGRVLIPLAARCSGVTGMDVSASMLAEARANCERAGVANVELLLADDSLSRLTREYDLVHSYIVLQHIPTRRGERIVHQLVSRLAPGGIGVLHVTHAHSLPLHSRILYWSRTHVPGAHALLNVALGRSAGAPMMQGNDYNVTRLLDILAELGCGEAYVRFSNHQGHRGVLLFFRNLSLRPFS